MKVTVPSPTVTTNLRISDPRQYGPTSRSPLLTKKARALAARASAAAIQEMSVLLRDHLDRRDDALLHEALAACPDSSSYSQLYGFLAYEACNWWAPRGRDEGDFYCLFGIPLTLHAPEDGDACSWKPSGWAQESNEQDLEELRRTLDMTGITAGMQDVAILPHLVDPDDVARIGFSDMRRVASDLLRDPLDLAASGKLPHRPWQSAAGGAQCRVIVMAARSRTMPRGLNAHSDRCAVALSEWAARCFDIPSTLEVVASSPERLLSLLSGKGLSMFNCARLVHLLGHSIPDGARPLSPFLSVVPTAAGPCQGKLEFFRGDASAVWALHGRASWQEEIQTIGLLLPDVLSRFVRVQLGLGMSEPEPGWLAE